MNQPPNLMEQLRLSCHLSETPTDWKVTPAGYTPAGKRAIPFSACSLAFVILLRNYSNHIWCYSPAWGISKRATKRWGTP